MVDLFCGCGGNTIAFATASEKLTVIGVDYDPQKLEYLRLFMFLCSSVLLSTTIIFSLLCRHNAEIYGVGERPLLICEDVYNLIKSIVKQKDGCILFERGVQLFQFEALMHIHRTSIFDANIFL